jgi:hypothetical protein
MTRDDALMALGEKLRVRAYYRHKREAVGNEVYGLTNNHFIVGYAEYGYTNWEELPPSAARSC